MSVAEFYVGYWMLAGAFYENQFLWCSYCLPGNSKRLKIQTVISQIEMSDLVKYEKVENIGEGAFGRAILVLSKSDNIQRVMKEINISKVFLASFVS
ncbi:unnamed protein product [Heterobilharzia americana]|nr:unnamed protein product [Heterobilharzia americana]